MNSCQTFSLTLHLLKRIRGTIFHYHAGGLPKYVKTSRFPVRLLANLALAKPNLGIEVSNSQLRESNYFSSERRVVIPNGLDVPVEKFKREKLEAVQKRILFIAGLRKSKGVLDVIETALKIKQKESNFIIDIAGSWQEPETEKLFQHERDIKLEKSLKVKEEYWIKIFKSIFEKKKIPNKTHSYSCSKGIFNT